MSKRVHMPARACFVNTPHYYNFVSRTGPQHRSESRLSRTFGAHFGDELYSKEELVAEMGAAFLCAIAGIANEHTDRNTTAYVQSWIFKLGKDDRLIVHAASSAQRAVDLIVGISLEDTIETPEQNRGGHCCWRLSTRNLAA